MKILMVCLGNICRSPLAQGILKKMATDRGMDWEIDSAGTESSMKNKLRNEEKWSKESGVVNCHIAGSVF